MTEMTLESSDPQRQRPFTRKEPTRSCCIRTLHYVCLGTRRWSNHGLGTGACAVGLTALASGLVDRSDWIAVDMPGGRVYVNQKSEADAVTLAGPAKFVFSGKLEI